MVDARLKDGSRVNAIIPPLAVSGPSLTIRKFPKFKLTTDDLMKWGSVTRPMAKFFEVAVRERMNICISGGTGSGKTTLLNIVSSFIPKHERIVTVEDVSELRLPQDHVVTLEARAPNLEGEGAITIRDLVKNCLRMRPDRIVIGECRSGEALDMLQAMNTGHDGSLTTIHSNSPRDCIARLETLVLMAGMDLPSRAIREQISSAINVIIQQARLSDGSRKVTAISEVTGIESGVVTLQDIFLFKQTGFTPDGKVIGKHEATGVVPAFIGKLRRRGIKVDMSMFAGDKPGGEGGD
jgi:pilus assembly protein CpaF